MAPISSEATLTDTEVTHSVSSHPCRRDSCLGNTRAQGNAVCLPGVLSGFLGLNWMDADGWKAIGGTLFFSMLPHVTTRVNHKVICFLFT